MQSSLYIGASGLKTHSAGMHTLSNNLANVSTVGYKQQSLLFEDLMYQDSPPPGSAWPQVNNQTGMGAQIGAVRTLFSVVGPFEPSNTVTDLALEGRGFFEVTNGDKTHYTRAGNFRFNKEGYLNDPNGFTLSGMRYANGTASGSLEPIKIDFNAEGVVQNAPKQTSAVSAYFNLGFSEDNLSSDVANPAFNMLSSWNGLNDTPLGAGYGSSQPMRLYDANGKTIDATIYFDGTDMGTGGQKVYEYLVTIPPGKDGSAAAGTDAAGLVMAGTLTFSAAGELIDMSAFTSSSGTKNLSDWTPATMVDGYPQFSLTTADGGAMTVSLDMGIKATGGWQNIPASAAAVGIDKDKLPSMGDVTREGMMGTTARGNSSNVTRYTQDGHGVGSLSGLDVKTDGRVVASYTNGQSETLFQIPVFRFTSEDGLRQEGMNHFSVTPECGTMEYGEAGTENYSKIVANSLELSNVDMAREMTSMIIIQRGFQMNSKSIQTTDTMLQKAMELKR